MYKAGLKDIEKNSIHSVCQVKDYDLLITDNNVSEDFLIQVRELGVAIESVHLKGVWKMYCILVTGIPAAGKSTMAEIMSERLKLPVISEQWI